LKRILVVYGVHLVAATIEKLLSNSGLDIQSIPFTNDASPVDWFPRYQPDVVIFDENVISPTPSHLQHLLVANPHLRIGDSSDLMEVIKPFVM
jgi:hypothetical protein